MTSLRNIWGRPLFVRGRVITRIPPTSGNFSNVRPYFGDEEKDVRSLCVHTIKEDEGLDPLNHTLENPSATFSTPRTTLTFEKVPTVVQLWTDREIEGLRSIFGPTVRRRPPYKKFGFVYRYKKIRGRNVTRVPLLPGPSRARGNIWVVKKNNTRSPVVTQIRGDENINHLILSLVPLWIPNPGYTL